jgi:twinkle protein
LVAYGGDGTGGYKKMAGTLIPVGELEIKAVTPRKISKVTCELYGYAYGTFSGKPVQVAPYYHRGQLVAQHLRFANKDFMWFGKSDNLELFGQRSFPAGGQRIIVTEGEIDAMSVAQMFHGKTAVVSIPSGTGSAKKSLMQNLEYVSSFHEIILAFDNDDPGKAAVQEVVHLFQPGRVKLFNYPEGVKDANELLQTGEGARIIEGVFKAIPYRPDGIISGETLWQSLLEPDEPGLTTPYPGLNQKLLGMRKGELYMFTAGSGVGKSTLVKELSYHFLVHHEQKIGVIALEENKKRVARGYCGIHLNKPLHISMEGVTQDALENAFKATVGSGRFWLYDHWGSLALDSLISRIRYLVVGCGVGWVVLDHISIVVSGLDEVAESERKLIDRLMTRLRSLIEETGVGVMAIVHLKRNDEGKSHNEGRQVRLSDLRGSGGLEQMSDVVVALERDQQSETNSNISTMRVLKNRPIGRLGVCDTLAYDESTGRLLSASMFTQTQPSKEEIKF